MGTEFFKKDDELGNITAGGNNYISFDNSALTGNLSSRWPIISDPTQSNIQLTDRFNKIKKRLESDHS
jgi:hypothetical protein